MKTREELILDLGTEKNIVVAGTSNSAKSTIMTYELLNSLKEGRPSAFLSKDYNSETLTKRLISGYMDKDLDFISDNELSYEDKELAMKKFNEFNEKYKESLLLGNIGELSIEKMEELIPRLKNQVKGLEDVYFDFSIRRFEDTYSSQIYDAIQRIADENKVRIILIENVLNTDLFLEYDFEKLNKSMMYVGLKREEGTNKVNAIIVENNEIGKTKYSVK